MELQLHPDSAITSQDGAQIVVLFYVLFVLCRSVYCLCVNVYCTIATG